MIGRREFIMLVGGSAAASPLATRAPGVYNLNTAVQAHELLPAATSIAFLVDPTSTVVADAQTRELEIARYLPTTPVSLSRWRPAMRFRRVAG